MDNCTTYIFWDCRFFCSFLFLDTLSCLPGLVVLSGVGVALKYKQRMQSKGNGMARDHLQGSEKTTPLPTTLPD